MPTTAMTTAWAEDHLHLVSLSRNDRHEKNSTEAKADPDDQTIDSKPNQNNAHMEKKREGKKKSRAYPDMEPRGIISEIGVFLFFSLHQHFQAPVGAGSCIYLSE